MITSMTCWLEVWAVFPAAYFLKSYVAQFIVDLTCNKLLLYILEENMLKIDLMDWHGEKRYAIYENFQIKNEQVRIKKPRDLF